MNHFRVATLLFVACLVVGCSRGAEEAAETAAAPATANIEPKARELARAMCDVLEQAQSFRITTHETHDHVLPSGEKTQRSSAREFVIRRPDGLWAHVAGSEGGEGEVWYDGLTLTVQSATKKMYAQAKMPPDLDQALDFAAENIDLRMPMADLFYSDPCDAYVGQETAGQYVGLEEIEGMKAHHLAFQDVAVDFDLWLQDGAQPLPKKVDLLYKLDEGAPRYSIVFDSWDLSPQVAADQFAFKPVEGAVRIRFEGQTPPQAQEPASEAAR